MSWGPNPFGCPLREGDMAKSHKKKIRTPKDQKPLTPQSREIPLGVVWDELTPDEFSRPQITLSRKKRLVTIKYKLVGFPLIFEVPIDQLHKARTRISKLFNELVEESPSIEVHAALDQIRKYKKAETFLDYLLYLLDAFLEAQRRYTGVKPRGVQAKRPKHVLERIRYACTWTYLFVDQERRKREKDRHVIIRYGERQLEQRTKDWSARSSTEKTLPLVAHLVHIGYATEWQACGLKAPMARLKYFDQHYIQPGLAQVGAVASKHPRMLDPSRNSFLRPIRDCLYRQMIERASPSKRRTTK